MKKILAVSVLVLICFYNPSQAKDGVGDLKLSKNILLYFQDYLTGKGKDTVEIGKQTGEPIVFTVTPSGKYANYF